MMDTRPVLFLDSGIGGIPYCRHFHRLYPAEPIVYLADRLHFPYGKRDRDELVAILSGLMEKIIRLVNPKIAVIACNTATVSALADLRSRFPGLPFVGTVPAVKPAVLATRTGKVGVLGTERTIEDPYIRELASQYGNGCEIVGIAAPELVEFVERRFLLAGENEKREQARNYLNRFRAAGVDVLALGCTHFLFLLEEFHREAAPGITVFESIEGISRRIESLLGDLDAFAASDAISANDGCRLIVTGDEPVESSWQRWADDLSFHLSLLETK
ncbi:glutamate racemase [Spirochaetia bacterium]|nr:glutamate racemase [Spirochaetia bacterium]